MLRHEGCGLRSPLEVELRQDRADVVLHGLVRQEDLGRDLLVRLALGDEEQDLPFLGSQARELIVDLAIRDLADPFQDPLRDGGVERSAPADGFECRDRSRARICFRR